MAYDTNLVVQDVKDRIGVVDGDTGMDPLIRANVKTAEAQLRLLIGEAILPEELAFIIVEVTLSKFNSYRMEGFQSKGQDGLSLSKFSADDFDPYKSYISMWLAAMGKDDPMNARVRFIGGGYVTPDVSGVTTIGNDGIS